MKKKENKLVVRKHNEIVREAINQFDYAQNRLMAIILGKYIHTKNNEFINAIVPINDFIKIMGIADSGQNIDNVKKAIDKFARNNTVGVYDPQKNKYIWRPFFKRIELDNTKVVFEWNDAMYPDLIDFKNKYTSYLANDYLKLSSVYSQNLYEQMKSYENMPTRPQITFNISDLHRIMQTEKVASYKDFNQFKTRCIARAIDDINEKTDIFVEMEAIKDKKDRRKAVGLAFTIRPKYEYFDYKGCWLNADQINDIIKNHGAKNKIIDLAKIKKDRPDYYTLLRKGNKSDYDIICNFIKQDKIKADEKVDLTPEEDLQLRIDELMRGFER